MNIYQRIEKLAAVLDEQGRKHTPIRVRCKRSYLIRLGIKPKEQDGPLMFGDHEILLNSQEV